MRTKAMTLALVALAAVSARAATIPMVSRPGATNIAVHVVAGATNEVVRTAKSYTDLSTNAAVQASKSYTDSSVDAAKSYTDLSTNAAVQASKSYTDSSVDAAKSYTDLSTNAAVQASKSYTDSSIGGISPAGLGAATPGMVTNIVHDLSLGGIWDDELEVWWTPVMRNGSLTYQATTNVNLNAED